MGNRAEIKVGMTVYGLMNSADGYFEAEGTVTEVDDKGFRVVYKVLPSGKRYKYGDIGRMVYLDIGEEKEGAGK